MPTLAKKFRKNSCVALTTGSRHLPTHREVRVGSKTDRLPGKTWETGVLTGRRDGADRGVKESVDSAGNGGETEARSTAPRRRATGDENRALREGPLELILRGALLNACALGFAASRPWGRSGSNRRRPNYEFDASRVSSNLERSRAFSHPTKSLNSMTCESF